MPNGEDRERIAEQVQRWRELGRPGSFLEFIGAPTPEFPQLPSPATAVEEFFPGYRELRSKTIQQKYEADKKVEEASKKVHEALSAYQRIEAVTRGRQQFPPSRGLQLLLEPPQVELEEARQKLEEAKLEALNSAAEASRAAWRHTVISLLPYMMADIKTPTRTIDDVLQRLPNDDLTDEDRQWLQEQFDRLSHLLPPEHEFIGPPEEVAKKIEAALKPPKLEIAAVHRLSVEELMKSFRVSPPPPVEGLSNEDFLDIMKSLQFSEEEIAQINDLHNFTVEAQKAWAEQAAAYELIKKGLTDPEVDELTTWQLLKMAALQPALFALEGLEKYFHLVPRPLAAFIITKFPSLREDTAAEEMRRIYNQYRELGEDSWEAYAKAFEESNTNFFLKLFLETVFDPTSYIGLGIITKFTKPLPYIGRFAAAMERGWLEMWDIPFKFIRKGIKAIPKTPGQAAAAHARAVFLDLRALMQRELGTLEGITAKQLKQLGEKAIQLARTAPTEHGHLGVRVGLHVISAAKEKLINLDRIGKWLSKVGSDLTPDLQLAQDLYYFFDLAFRQALTPDEVAPMMLSRMGADITVDNLSTMTKLIVDEIDEVLKEAGRYFVGSTARDVLENLFRRIEDTYVGVYTSPLWKFMNKGGKVTGWSRFVDRIVKSSLISWIDKRITAPMANQYLLFTNYGPFNVLETAMRSFLGAGEILYPKNSSPIDEFVRISEGLANTPYEFIRAQRELGRLEIAVTGPKGETVVFSRGKIPAITKELPKGFTIRIGNKDYTIKSLQHWNDMWADIGTRQRAWYMLTMYKKKLAEVAPDEVAMIGEVIERHEPILDRVKGLSRKQKRELRRIIEQDATVSPEAVRAHAVPLPEWERRKALYEVNKVLDKLQHIYTPHKNFIREQVLNGKAFKDIDGLIETVEKSMKEFNIASLTAEIQQMKKLVNAYISTQPQTAEELVKQIAFLSDMVEAIGNRISDVRRLVQQRAAELAPGEKEAFHEATWETLMKFIDEAETDIDYLVNLLKRNINGEEFRIDWDRIVWQGFESQEQIDKVIEVIEKRFPLEVKARINSITIDPNLPPTVLGEYEHIRGRLTLRSPELIEQPTLMHEVMHGIQSERLNAGDYQFYLDFLKSIGAEGTEQWRFVQMAKDQGLDAVTFIREEIRRFEYTRRPSEMMAANFGIYTVEGQELDRGFARWMNSHLPMKLSHPKLSENQRRLALELLDNTRRRVAALVTARYRERLIAEDLIMRKPKFESPEEASAWWREFYEARDEAWQEFRSIDAQLYRQMEELRMALSPRRAPEPSLPPPVETELTPAHVAYIFQITGDDLTRALIRAETMTLLGRDKFIAYVSTRADQIAGKFGKTAAEIGFTDEAIGKVYDQLLRSVGIEPQWAEENVIVPAMQNLTELKNELYRIKATRAMPESDYLALNEFVNSVADDLEKLPMYQAAAREITLEPHKTQPNIFSIRLRGKLVGDLETFEVQELDAIVINTLIVDERGIVNREFLSNLADALEDIARQRGLSNIAVIPFPRHAPMYRRAGFQLTHVSKPVEIPVEAQVLTPDVDVYIRKVRPAPTTPESWWAKKEEAMSLARQQYELDFTDYENHNMVDAAARVIFPFWTYEWQRWFWLPRTFLRTPGTFTGLGRYMNYTDSGYISIPGTDVQFNPLRGTVFMGGFRRLFLRDYPEYYDAFPGMEFIDYINRLGFYPGINVMLPIVAVGTAISRKPEWGELLPAWAKTSLDAVVAADPTGTAVKVMEQIFPDRFRHYLTILTLNAQGYDGLAIWDKVRKGEQLTEEEERLWTRAVKKATGLKGIMFEQLAMFRLRPKEYREFLDNNMKMIEEMTGVPVEVQKIINRRYPITGKRFSDLYPLDILQQRILYESESWQRWYGVTTPLYPSTWQEEDMRVREYWEEVERIYDRARLHGITDRQGNLIADSVVNLNRQLVNGQISPEQWREERGDALAHARAAIVELGNSRYFRDVPLTIEEREARLAERGVPAPVIPPDEELLYKYFELRPEKRYDWETGRMVWDFDTYFGLIDAIIETLQEPYRQRFIDRIQFNWTPMEKLYWHVSREFLRPYRKLRDIVMAKYPDELKQVIRRYEIAKGAEREALQEVIDPNTGNKLISQFRRDLREARDGLRRMNPELDAWLAFWGITDKLLTTEAQEIYDNLRKTYLTEDMIEPERR